MAMLNYVIASAKNIFAFFPIVLNLGGSLIFSYSRAILFSYRDVKWSFFFFSVLGDYYVFFVFEMPFTSPSCFLLELLLVTKKHFIHILRVCTKSVNVRLCIL